MDGSVYSKNDVRSAIFKEIDRIKKENAGKKLIPNEDRIAEFKGLIEELESSLSTQDGCSIDAKICYPAPSHGSMEIYGGEIVLESNLLKRAVEFCNEMEIAPYEDGNVSLIFGVDGLMRRE